MEQNKQRLFLSYAWGNDQPFVLRLDNDLRARGYEPWMDKQDMPSRGRTLAQKVVSKINDCDRVVALIGSAAIKSAGCQAERERVLDKGEVVMANLRARTLKSSLQKLLEDPAAKDAVKNIYGHPLVAGLTNRTQGPAYISSHIFSVVPHEEY